MLFASGFILGDKIHVYTQDLYLFLPTHTKIDKTRPFSPVIRAVYASVDIMIVENSVESVETW